MTRVQLEQKVRDLLREGDVMIWDRVQKALDSGAIDFDQYGSGYILPKIIVSAVYSDLAWQYEPLGPFKKDVENLKKFL